MKLPQAFSPAVMAELAKPVVPAGSNMVELKPSPAAWYVIETYPKCERDVADELVAHGVGIFVPEIEDTVVRRGRKTDRKTMMFTRYIFVFTWLTDRNYSLISATEGVFRWLSNDGKPVVVEDRFIELLRKIENSMRPFPLIPIDDGAEVVVRKGKKFKHTRRKPKYVDPVTDTVRVRPYGWATSGPWSAFEDGSIIELDSEGRNQTLAKALGLS